MSPVNPRSEMRELQRLFEETGYSDEFERLRRASKWGEQIREQVIAGIEQKRHNAIEDGILFLEENPRYFRSGYFKASIASKLKAVPLSPAQQNRLLEIIHRAICSTQVGPEFNEYARLAIKLATPTFLESVANMKDKVSDWSKRRCERILSRCQLP